METVLITGCSSGIGAATARTFLGAGWRVYATARDPADLDALADAGCETAALDVTDPDQIADVVARIDADAGRIDCLVNNAGYGQFGAVEDVPPDRLTAQFDVNVVGPHRLARAVLPHMRVAEGGTIVSISSTLAGVATPGSGPYAASKAALESMSDALRAEVAGHGIDVVLVVPGPVETRFRRRAMRDVEALQRTDSYEAVYDLLEDWNALGSGFAASDPHAVADAVLNAATCSSPPPRTPVGPAARLARYGRFVPVGIRDRVFALLLRLA